MDRDRDRDDITVKDILSQLSQDKTVIEEVRKIVVRGLKAQGSDGDSQRGRVAPRELDGIENEDASERASGDTQNPAQTPQSGKVVTQKALTTTSMKTSAESGKELAFTVSKDSDTYRNIYSTVQWYRDSFLVGSDYANQRNAEQTGARLDGKMQRSGETVINGIKIDKESATPKVDPSTSMGHPLLLSAAQNYLHSIAAVDLLHPYATWVVSKDGPLLEPATQSLAQSIPLGQSSCDWAMRENMLWVLKDEEWKEFAKSITTTYVDRSYKDG
mmetsp:Transcript_5496/g.9987  ORF Transcript_5496/g.9987 Transcript_5496/m.9987 type:complete len:273 (-) Transcript_5496:198-1016(-)|eukprot:CAMPEP_0183725432 /NCGR_PEP_ID=MMETSP0737-20130205/20647_1 /TAXON_ID=385413 /ORGANISM="Thalassiosira miniscula, Strain CCMP1093" /LENGTH=272 /DNA_ID=CAMNT_0025956425 /DNA_START=156 /DNA_END=974 /DNA_ORIENTATION=+